MKARITALGSYLPEKVLTNRELEQMVETSDEWIVTRTGMRERRIASAEEFTSDMGAEAAKKALEKSGLAPVQIDLILVATTTPDYPFPSTASLIQAKLGLTSAAAFDLQAACTGYLYGLSVAKAFIESGMYRHVLLVASEKLSSVVNYKDRNTCVLFGDGASAAIISCEGKGLLLREICLGCDGEPAEIVRIPAGGSRRPASLETVSQNLHCIEMDGKEVFKHAVRRMESSSKACMEKAGLAESDISWIIPHQANIRIIEAIAKRFNVPMERVYITIGKYGNTSASSVGIALDELLQEKKVASGQHLLLTAFGAGLTWGSIIVTHE